MIWKVEVDSMAEKEIFSAIEYYEKANPAIAEKFEEAIEIAIQKLKSHPYFEVRYNQKHCLPLKRFPYMLHYQLEEDLKLVYVTGCIHTSLNPDKSWR